MYMFKNCEFKKNDSFFVYKKKSIHTDTWFFLFSGLPFQFQMVILGVISSVSVILNICFVIQIFLRYVKNFEF